jgi:hypothetical protein
LNTNFLPGNVSNITAEKLNKPAEEDVKITEIEEMNTTEYVVNNPSTIIEIEGRKAAAQMVPSEELNEVVDNRNPIVEKMMSSDTVVVNKVEEDKPVITDLTEDITVEGEATIGDLVEESIIDNYDETPQDVKIEDYQFNDIDKKNIFFGASLYHSNKPEIKKDTDLFTVFDFYRKESRYKDVYLPVTNVAVRIYEFNNLDILINKMVLESEKDLAYRTQINMAGTQTRDFVSHIFENAEFLTSDREQLTPVHFEMVSSLDVPFIILAATALMGEIYEATAGTAGHSISEQIQKSQGLDIWQDTCESCQTNQRLFKNVDEILKAQYTEEIIDYANKNYDPNDTLENNIKRSKKVKAKGIRYTKGDKGIDTIFFMKDPDWIRGHDYDRAFDSYIINKYMSNKYIKELPKMFGPNEWINMTNREKAAEIQKRIERLRNFEDPDGDTDTLALEEVMELANKLVLDIQNFTITKYLHMVRIEDSKNKDVNGNPTILSTIQMTDLTLEEKLTFLEKYLDETLVEKMLTQINAIREFGKEAVEYKWTCKKCGKLNNTAVEPIMFVFLLLQSKLWKKEKALSTT